ncbi:hypothetical protein JR316_0000099 [Psilocybe cubensis]|uniref:Uncharacterized protein n=2 Tax=Psilocybe cubensis TaxID=181762 RepID=A0ACB8HFV4_PSICU|nr:hypothetical protein JR316_0000099 [Psilocybe cubensis]KAH9486035.1 hypothetical protein JR316_0000099 [Psilocybe cubensis]
MQIQAVLAATLNLYWRYKCIIIRRANETHDPITSKLPNELVVIIFKFACDDDWDGPLTLGAVCQQWRAIIYATPSFWTTIWLNVKLAFGSSYNPDSAMSSRNQRKMDLFRGWLARSGELPISLWLTLGKKYTGQANEIQRELRQDEVEREFGPFVALVNSYSSRFKFIDIEALQSMLLALGPAYEGPLLRRLKITALDGGHYYTPEKEDEDTEEEFTAISRQAADGRNLELFLINHEFNNIDCQRLNVTNISSQYFETESLLRALKETPDVLECRMAYYIHTPLATAEPVTHLRLTSLSIKDGLNQGLEILMEVCLPSLKVLKVHLPGQSDVVDNCILISEFIHNSNCKLTELELFFANLQENEVEAIMAYLLWTRLLHDLEEFTLLKLDFNPDSLFDVLSRSSLNGIHSAYAKEDGNCKYDHLNPQEVDPDTMVFLPSLKSFTYSLTTSDLRDTIPWNTLVDSFGPLSKAQRRPLTSVKIIPEWKLGNLKTTKPLLDSLSLSQDSVKNLITAIQAGCHIMLPAEIEEDDLAEV